MSNNNYLTNTLMETGIDGRKRHSAVKIIKKKRIKNNKKDRLKLLKARHNALIFSNFIESKIKIGVT